jgi:hypothetical protein
VLDNMGHDLPAALLPEVVEAIADHVAAAEDAGNGGPTARPAAPDASG